jgi:enoyl-CoA hydratase/carnithine racemase
LSSPPAGAVELAGGKLRLDRPAPSVARLTLDHPAKRNALDHAILDAIAETLPGLDDVRCLLVTAVGPVFSAGYDIGRLPGSPGFAAEAEALVAHPFTSAIEAIAAFPFPTVAALNGHAIGGGLELAVSCDLRLAAAGIRLGMPPARLGLIYSHTGLRTFLDAIGAPRTRELFLRARPVDAERALTWGLVNEVVEPAELERAAVAYAAEVASNAPLSLAGNKRVLRELLAAEGALDPAVERELIDLRESCFQSEDFQEGVRAFGEKREPRWRGR